MSIDLAALVDALIRRRRDLGDWSARSRGVTLVELAGSAEAPVARIVRRVELSARVHVDGPTGRGSADLWVASGTPDVPLGELVEEAIARAAVSIGPGWQSSPPGAPARVSLADRTGGEDEPAARRLWDLLVAAARKADAAVIAAEVGVESTAVALATSRGLDTRWNETSIRHDAIVAAGTATARATDLARRWRNLRPADRVTGAVERARARAGAGETPPGRRAVLFPAAVLGGDGAALLDALTELGDATLARQGLARARVGDPIVAGADAAAQPLSLESDGTLRWGPRSAPLGEHGEPVRRFPIVTGGVLVGLALDEREAALRGVPPNGGPRNLVVGPGASEAAALRAPGALEVLEVAYADVEPLTGRVAIGIGLATLHDDAGPRTVAGREIQGDLVAAFARSRRTAGRVRSGAYHGPELVLLPDLEIV